MAIQATGFCSNGWTASSKPRRSAAGMARNCQRVVFHRLFVGRVASGVADKGIEQFAHEVF